MSTKRGMLDTPATEMLASGIKVAAIPRASIATPAALKTAIDSQSPMIFSGLADTWPARTSWNPSTLRQTHGAREVTALMNLPDKGVLFSQDQRSFEKTMPFSEFLDVISKATSAAPCYLAYKRADDIFDPADYDFEAILGAGMADGDTRVWIGSAGTRSMLHSDLKDNLFCQIWGEKSVTLLPWSHSRAAYPFTDNLVNSQVDLAEVDLEKYPRLRSAEFMHSTMLPGDILYIPRGCWHDIRSQTPSISINHWFGASQSLGEYLRLLLLLGPKYWFSTVRDFIFHGLLKRSQKTLFFFSPPSTGRRLYDALRWGNFSKDNDPSKQ
ncbi:cupin-like domain-containing protein [Streptomyces sp900105245]|uniref:Cupin-like domain-containing protein n=1 Tax=Streptomyces sp. 900105245 TaxID=3154379 RepID=A0ABV1UKN6_9ACTN